MTRTAYTVRFASNVPAAARAAFLAEQEASAASFAPTSSAVALPISIIGTFTAYAPDGDTVTRFKIAARSFDSWESAQEAIEVARDRRPDHITARGFVRYAMRDANGACVPARRDGWTLNDGGVPVAACAACGTVGPHDKDCCDGFELPF
jgi:hypothetical protein